MCQLSEKYTKSDTFTGYKVALKKKGRYYSLTTGIEYKVGKVRRAISENASDHRFRGLCGDYYAFNNILMNTGVIDKSYICLYCKDMVGRTGVLTNLDDALFIYNDKKEYDCENFTAVLLTMTISGKLMTGSTRYFMQKDFNVCAGRHIDKIVEMHI